MGAFQKTNKNISSEEKRKTRKVEGKGKKKRKTSYYCRLVHNGTLILPNSLPKMLCY